MKVSTRLAIIACAAVLAATFAMAGAAYQTLAQVDVEQARARIAFVIGNLRRGLETNVAIGLRLEDLAIAQDMIERQRLADPSIVAIDILGPDGRTLFSTDRGVIGEAAPEAWRRAGAAAEEGWIVGEGEQIVFGAPIDIGIGQPVGEVVVAVAAEGRGDPWRLLGGGTAALVLAIGGLAGALAAALSYTAGRRATRPLAEAAAILAGAPPGPGGGPARAARECRDAALADLDAAAVRIRAIDDAG